MIVLIPAYEPDLRLVHLVRSLPEAVAVDTVLVVDDGSGPTYDEVFAQAADAGAVVLRHPRNRGKGYALRAGFAWVADHRPDHPVVCADCDGQHSPADIGRVADHIAPRTMLLGGRRFTGDVPLRSRLGNAVTRRVFGLATGLSVHDTQTGLRGYPPGLLGWLGSVPGDRFEYEFNLLLEARTAGVEVCEIPIETIYLNRNASSHFRPVQDSVRVLAPLLRFGGSSLASAAVDFAALLALHALTGQLLVSVVAARVLSAGVNFGLNRALVFRDRGAARRSLPRYVALAGALLTANYLLLALLTSVAGWALAPAKVVVEASLFVASYLAQRRAVFCGAGGARGRSTPTPRERARV